GFGITCSERSNAMDTLLNQRYFRDFLLYRDIVVRPASISTLWVNITKFCNQACSHCHVDASPNKTERMDRQVIDRCLEVLFKHEGITSLDITGGAPELHPDFNYFVIEARKLGKHVFVRHNLTVISDGNPLTGESKACIPEFFAQSKVEIIASLPHYSKEVTDTLRGEGVFRKSLAGIRRLNEVGYGQSDSGLIINLVYNHDGPITINERMNLEAKYRNELASRYGLVFNQLYTVTNMPINRFLGNLLQSGSHDDYMKALVAAFNPAAVSKLVCRSVISVGYDGRLFDCDFNQMLGMQIMEPYETTIFNADFNLLMKRRIRFGAHCFGCTAGGGSN
ncbi:arsenosugar biosynthesis radical SAM (seleno)protein ArsS, partial [Chloroflexota bacterium]